jgi:imidazole glycerol-phosphate synthase subunit HisH
MIAIINYGSGNVGAIANIYKNLGICHAIVEDASLLIDADHYILPGVGSFDFTIKKIRQSGLYAALFEQVINRGKPLLGICVGMQLLADSSEEGQENGLSWIGGRVDKIRTNAVRLPHMGWNSVAIDNDQTGLFEKIDTKTGFYFLHNYHFCPADPASVLATTSYGDDLVCAVSNNRNIFGVQFHPEKSHDNGIRLFKNFASL